jgi:hypothetical protein
MIYIGTKVHWEESEEKLNALLESMNISYINNNKQPPNLVVTGYIYNIYIYNILYALFI